MVDLSSVERGAWPGVGGMDPAQVLEALSAALFANNDDLVWDFGTDGSVRRVNGRVAPMLGYEPADLVGRAFSGLVLAADVPAVEAAFRHALGGRAGATTCRLRHREGRVVAVRATLIPLVARGAVVRVYAGCRDVTAEVAAAAALAEREALYSLIVEQSPECVSIYQDGRHAYINPAGARLHGVEAAALLGRPWTACTHPEDLAAVDALLAEVLASPPGATRAYERRLVRPDGSVAVVESTATAVVYRGAPAVHSFGRDVTARRRTEAELLRAERFEALGRLAAGVAHDFNNLLAVMLAAVEVAADAVPDGDPLRDDLDAAAAAARRGRGLTRQLLTFARREPLRPQPIDVNQLVRGMAELLRRAVGAGVRLEFALAPDPGLVVADPAHAEQALLNLVVNARDATPAGGRVLVETAAEGADVRLTVRDTGAGIAPEVRPRLFEPFFTTKADGTGLGLAAVYGVVTGAGGRVEVESEPGRGAAFHLLLPRADAPPPGAPGAAPAR